MARRLDYASFMHRAMRGMVREVLREVAENGLPGDHHFFITFATMHPEVEIADWLSDRYPESMTVVMQNWFDGLEVGEDGFAVTLNFGDQPEPLFIPYDAIQKFVDPSVRFGLQFDHPEEEERRPAALGPPAPSEEAAPEADEEERGDAEIVSLDKFRK